MEDKFEKPLMASEIIGAMSQPKRTFYNYVGGSIAEGKIRETQSALVQAQKFIVSNKLIDHAVEASMSKPKVLLEMMKRAIPPFKNMFIEWDEDYRVNALWHMYEKYLPQYRDKIQFPKDHAERIGYHIYHYESPTGDSWFMYEMWLMIDKKWFASPLASIVRNDEDWDMNKAFRQFKFNEAKAQDLPTEFKNYMLDAENYSKETVAQGQKIIGAPYTLMYFADWDKTKKEDRFRAFTLKDREEDYGIMHDIYSRVTTVQGRAMHWMIPKEQFKQGWSVDQMTKISETHLQLFSGGDIRFIVSVLSILNYDLIVKQVQKPAKHKVKHIRFGRSVPTNEYSLLNIELPKPKGKTVYEKIFSGHGTPKKWHKRRGHWRRYRDAQGNVTKRIWVAECEAGSKAYGEKINDYNLQKSD